MSTQQLEPMPSYQRETPPSQGVGCFVYGCLTVILVTVGTLLCGGFGTYWFVSSQVQKYTAEAPGVMPAVEFSDAEMQALEIRLNTFKTKLDAGDTPQDLVLTAEEINALIAKNKDLRDKVFIRIEDGEITGDISIPADSVWGGEGRFFNASASFDVTMENGVLIVTLTGAEVQGESVPDQYIEPLRQENLAKDVYKDPENAKMLRRFESIEIVDDKIVMKLRPEAESGEGDESGDTAEEAKGDAEPEPTTESDSSEKLQDVTE